MAPDWSKKDDQELYALLDEIAGEEFETVERIRNAIADHFEEDDGTRKFKITQITARLMRLAHEAECGATPKTVLSAWPKYRGTFFKVEKPKKVNSSKASTSKSIKTGTKELSSNSDRFAKTPTPQSQSQDRSTKAQTEAVQEVPPSRFDEQPINLVPDDKHKNADTAVTSSRGQDDGTAAVKSQAKATMELNETDQRLIDSVRRIKSEREHKSAPEHSQVKRTVDQSLRKLARGIRCFRQAQPTAIITSAKLTDAAANLGSELIDGSVWRQQPIQSLNTLFDDPAATVDVILQAYAASAIYQWVLVGFQDLTKTIMAAGDKDVFDVLLQENKDLFASLKNIKSVEYLENIVKPTLPSHASRLQHELLDIFRSLCVPRSNVLGSQGGGDKKQTGYSSRLEQYTEWQKLANEALLEVLTLRLTMQKASGVEYVFRFPKTGEEFDGDWMQPAHDGIASIAPGSQVYLCVQPAVFAYVKRTHDADRNVVVPAKVIIEGIAAEVRFA